MNTTQTEQKSGLSTTSLVLAIVWLVLCITIIGALVWVPLAIAALIIWIIALVKKQKKWTAIAGIIISWFVILVTIIIVTVGFVFLKNNADTILNPIMEFSEMMKNDPELAALMQNPEFANEFEYIFKSRLTEKLGTAEIENLSEIKSIFPMMFDEMKNVMLELKDKY